MQKFRYRKSNQTRNVRNRIVNDRDVTFRDRDVTFRVRDVTFRDRDVTFRDRDIVGMKIQLITLKHENYSHINRLSRRLDVMERLHDIEMNSLNSRFSRVNRFLE